MMKRFEEIERPRFFSGRIRKLNAVFPNEWTGLQFFKQAHSLKSKVSVSHQRLVDMMTRKSLLLEQHHTAAFARQDARDRASRWATAHDNNVVLCFRVHKVLNVAYSFQFWFKKFG